MNKQRLSLNEKGKTKQLRSVQVHLRGLVRIGLCYQESYSIVLSARASTTHTDQSVVCGSNSSCLVPSSTSTLAPSRYHTSFFFFFCAAPQARERRKRRRGDEISGLAITKLRRLVPAGEGAFVHSLGARTRTRAECLLSAEEGVVPRAHAAEAAAERTPPDLSSST